MRYKYELGKKLKNGLYELYRDGVKTSAQIKSLDLIQGDDVFIAEGAFYGGFFTGGDFHGGDFYDGTFGGGYYLGGYYLGGDFHGGVFHGGVFTGGDFHGGIFHGGIFHGGIFHGGFFLGGDFHGGDFYYGCFYGGSFRGGCFHDGRFRGGDFYDGSFGGGFFLGGSYKTTPLQIYGSKHFLNYTEHEGEPSIRIGCHTYSIKYWLDHYAEIGVEEDYSEEQIEEYKDYIDMFAKRYL